MQLEITEPDDWHLHLRDGPAMADVVGHSARSFARAVIMPNLQPPITTTAEALAYHQKWIDAHPEHHLDAVANHWCDNRLRTKPFRHIGVRVAKLLFGFDIQNNTTNVRLVQDVWRRCFENNRVTAGNNVMLATDGRYRHDRQPALGQQP